MAWDHYFWGTAFWINSVSVHFWDWNRYYITASSGEESKTKSRIRFLYKCVHTRTHTISNPRTARCQYFRPYSAGFKLYCSPLQYWKTNMLWSTRGNTLRSSSAPVANQTEGKSPTSFWRSHVSSWGILERGVSTYSIRWDFFLFFVSSWRVNGTHLACEEGLWGDFRTRWIRRAIWLREEGQSVFIVDGSRSLEEFSLTTVQFSSHAKWSTAFESKHENVQKWRCTLALC